MIFDICKRKQFHQWWVMMSHDGPFSQQGSLTFIDEVVTHYFSSPAFSQPNLGPIYLAPPPHPTPIIHDSYSPSYYTYGEAFRLDGQDSFIWCVHHFPISTMRAIDLRVVVRAPLEVWFPFYNLFKFGFLIISPKSTF